MHDGKGIATHAIATWFDDSECYRSSNCCIDSIATFSKGV